MIFISCDIDFDQEGGSQNNIHTPLKRNNSSYSRQNFPETCRERITNRLYLSINYLSE